MAQILSGLALVATLLPPALFFAGRMEVAQVKNWMLLGALAWFIATPFWMEHKATE